MCPEEIGLHTQNTVTNSMTLFSCRVVFFVYLAYDMDLHCLTSVGSNLDNRTWLTPTRIMNSVNLISMIIVSSVGIFNDIVAMNNNCRE